MSSKEQRRAWVLSKLTADEIGVAEAAAVLGLSERSIRRLRARLASDGPAGLVHGNRGPDAEQPPHGGGDRADRRAAAEGRYAGVNDCHLAELLAEQEGISRQPPVLRRLLREAGRPAPSVDAGARHRSRRDRLPREGMLLQTDGSRHDWLGDRGPRLTLVGLIDDATGRVTAATFREQEDSAGYLEVLAPDAHRATVCPAPSTTTAQASSSRPSRPPLTLEEQLLDARVPTQLGRTFAELGIGSIGARSPQAKGRVERLWGTLQDRLVAELRLAGIDDRDGANAFLPATSRTTPASRCPRLTPCRPGGHCRRAPSSGSAASSTGAPWRVTAPCVRVPRPCSAAKPNGRSRAGQTVELHLRLDGRLVVWDGQRSCYHPGAARRGPAAGTPSRSGRGRHQATECRDRRSPAITGPPLAPGPAGHEAPHRDQGRTGGADRIAGQLADRFARSVTGAGAARPA